MVALAHSLHTNYFEYSPTIYGLNNIVDDDFCHSPNRFQKEKS